MFATWWIALSGDRWGKHCPLKAGALTNTGRLYQRCQAEAHIAGWVETDQNSPPSAQN
jgi:hypothetical protein